MLLSIYVRKQTILLSIPAVDSEGFWRWCITLRNTGFLDFSHRSVF
jgi:hypothetical protein